jgi:homeobox-leucine zipper protein
MQPIGLEGQPQVSQSADSEHIKAMKDGDEYESRSGSDNMEGGSGDDNDPDRPPRSKKRYHRHTPRQIQEMEM